MPSKTANTSSPPFTTRSVVFVIYPKVKLLDIAGPLQVFSDTCFDNGKHAYRTAVVSLAGNSTPSDTPVSLSSDAIEKWYRRKIHTLIVVGGEGAEAASKNEHLIANISALAAKAERVGSVCSGALVLAACGLLDNRRAVTHWDTCEKLAHAYPQVRVESDPIFIKDERIWSSAGVTAGIDMALAMIAEDLGRQVALSTARSLVTYFVRPGGQSQFSEALDRQVSDTSGRFDALHDWMRNNLHKDLRVEVLAGKANMSSRNFARQYVEQMGQTPAKAVLSFRVEAARELLENSALTMTSIASRCGFGNDEHMRRAFTRVLNVAPNEYRKRFQLNKR